MHRLTHSQRQSPASRISLNEREAKCPIDPVLDRIQARGRGGGGDARRHENDFLMRRVRPDVNAWKDRLREETRRANLSFRPTSIDVATRPETSRTSGHGNYYRWPFRETGRRTSVSFCRRAIIVTPHFFRCVSSRIIGYSGPKVSRYLPQISRLQA